MHEIFWILCCLCAGICTVYFTRNVHQNCDKSPLIVTINPLPTPVEDIPFPAVTICNSNSVKKNVAEDILMRGTAAEKRMLEEICDLNSSSRSEKSYKSDWNDLHNFMLKAHHPCNEMLKICKWHLQEIDCSRLFATVLTDEGFCCTFNQLPLKYILRYPPKDRTDASLNDALRKKYQIDDWNPERGYSPKVPYNVFPFRSPGPGRPLGLKVVLDVDVDNSYCSTSSVGFKILLHNPAEIQSVTQYSFSLPPGYETDITFTPVMRDAIEALKEIDVKKRRCYFTNEKSLQFYRIYSKANCKMECVANNMLDICGCVSHFLPKNQSVKVCGIEDNDCIRDLEARLVLLKISTNSTRRCHCYPGCVGLSFEHRMSYGKLTGSFRLKESFFKNISMEYLQKNIAIIHIFFSDIEFNKLTTSVLCNFTDLLSSAGGLLSLFLGFSVVSVAEVFYYFTMRLLCKTLRLKRKVRQRQE